MDKFKRYIAISGSVYLIIDFTKNDSSFNIAFLKITVIVILLTYLLVQLGIKIWSCDDEV